MNNITENTPSAFAQLIDKLRTRSEEELKLLYMKFFSAELSDEWASITTSSNFENDGEENIIEAILKRRYRNRNV